MKNKIIKIHPIHFLNIVSTWFSKTHLEFTLCRRFKVNRMGSVGLPSPSHHLTPCLKRTWLNLFLGTWGASVEECRENQPTATHWFVRSPFPIIKRLHVNCDFVWSRKKYINLWEDQKEYFSGTIASSSPWSDDFYLVAKSKHNSFSNWWGHDCDKVTEGSVS